VAGLLETAAMPVKAATEDVPAMVDAPAMAQRAAPAGQLT
jgi:hypothetical protein